MGYIALAQTATPLPAFPIKRGARVEGNINATIPVLHYTFDVKSGDKVTLHMEPTSGDLDPLLLLFAPNGDLLQQNDDAGNGGRDAQIDQTIATAGTYTIEATRFQQDQGQTSGTFRLTLNIAGAAPTSPTTDPLSMPPTFGVDFSYINYQELEAGTIADASAKQYFAVGARQGDLVRVTMARTGGDLVPQVHILNGKLEVISQEASASDTEAIVYATLPESGWYLIEAASQAGGGSFSLYVDRRSVAVLQIGQSVAGEFTPQTPSMSYIFNAHIGDEIFANLASSVPGSQLVPELRLLDLSLDNIVRNRAVNGQSAQIRAVTPRSGTYILVATNLRQDRSGGFSLRLSGFPVDINKLPVNAASYNSLYKGTINDTNYIAYYRFSGKAGELVTIEMDASTGNLDPYVILTDSDLNELAYNDNAGSTSNARITQFALPKDGDYFILATRAGLANSKNRGGYNLALTVGRLSLLPGNITATVTWDSDADLNLFVRDPAGRTVSWSNPHTANGGTLQIDSNTQCQTPTAQPVEHIYYPPGSTLPDGQYQVWVWYQNVCTHPDPVTFALSIDFNGKPILDIPVNQMTLQPDQRFEAAFRLSENSAVVSDIGRITTPSAQQRASQGGDTLLLYGQNVTGTITDDVYALFYQFDGKQGDNIIVTADKLTGDLDPIVVLRDDADNNLQTNDDGDGSSSNSRLTFTLPKDGPYVIAVTRYGARDGITTGDFRLTLLKAR